MPELPEVENIRLQLEKYLVNHVVKNIDVRWGKSFARGKEKLFEGRIIKVRRFGKVLSMDFANGHSALIHVKMTGQLIYQGPNKKDKKPLSKKVVGGVPGKHTHVIFQLDRGGILYFNDYRKFGWIDVVRSENIAKHKFIKKLGPEPLGKLNIRLFEKIVSSTSRQIKLLLMDQSKIGGVGNIYANDALWLAKINPKKPADKLSVKEIERLFVSIEKVLKEGLKRGGASELAFVTPDGQDGKYQKYFLVYGREGDTCQRCKAKIKKLKISGRGTYYCPNCQK